MKCIQAIESGKVERVDDQTAKATVAKGTHVYVPKSVWRASRPTRPSMQDKLGLE